MEIKDEIQQLDSELEHERQELREDAEQIELKIEATRDMVSPSRIIARKPLLITGVALLAGLVFGYWRKGVIETAKPTVEAGRPAAKAAFGPALKAILTGRELKPPRAIRAA